MKEKFRDLPLRSGIGIIVLNKKNKVKTDKQLKIIDKATDRAIQIVEQERKGKERDYIFEWFRYIEITSKELSKYLN